MGHMKDLDRRIRQGGDDAIAAVGEYVKELEGEVASARACAEMMLQGTGQKLGEELARRVIDEHYPRRWISVEERLPEPDYMGNAVAVLVYLPRGKDVCIGFCDNDEYGVRWQCESTDKPSHWMPLPEPPEVKK